DRAHAEPDHVAIRTSRVALEISLQGSVALRYHQFVILQRKMVHADIGVACRSQPIDRGAEQSKLCRGVRKRFLSYAVLRLEHPRQVRIAVHGEPLRSQADDRVDRPRVSFDALERQPVDQVEVDRGYAGVARAIDDGGRLFHALHPVHSLLHAAVEVLYSEADAIEAELRETRHRVAIDGTRIDLYRHFGCFVDRESTA